MDCSPPGSSVHGVARVDHNLVTKPPNNNNNLAGYWLGTETETWAQENSIKINLANLAEVNKAKI